MGIEYRWRKSENAFFRCSVSKSPTKFYFHLFLFFYTTQDLFYFIFYYFLIFDCGLIVEIEGQSYREIRQMRYYGGILLVKEGGWNGQRG